MTDLTLKAMFGDHPITRALKQGEVATPGLTLDMADVSLAQNAFKPAVRDLAFDVCEIAIVTYLMAKSRGVPLTLLPAVLVARYQHGRIAYNRSKGAMTPTDLHGKRVGIRSYTVTTVTWLRGILADDFGVDLDAINWVTFEDAHVAGVEDPPGVVRAPPGATLNGMLISGDLDAAVIGGAVDHPDVQPLFADPAAEAAKWSAKYDAIQLNHLVAVKDSLLETHADAVRAVYRQLRASKQAAGLPPPGERDMNPFGIEANRRNLEVVIDCVYRQGLIDRRFTVDELFRGVEDLT